MILTPAPGFELFHSGQLRKRDYRDRRLGRPHPRRADDHPRVSAHIAQSITSSTNHPCHAVSPTQCTSTVTISSSSLVASPNGLERPRTGNSRTRSAVTRPSCHRTAISLSHGHSTTRVYGSCIAILPGIAVRASRLRSWSRRL